MPNILCITLRKNKRFCIVRFGGKVQNGVEFFGVNYGNRDFRVFSSHNIVVKRYLLPDRDLSVDFIDIDGFIMFMISIRFQQICLDGKYRFVRYGIILAKSFESRKMCFGYVIVLFVKS